MPTLAVSGFLETGWWWIVRPGNGGEVCSCGGLQQTSHHFSNPFLETHLAMKLLHL